MNRAIRVLDRVGSVTKRPPISAAVAAALVGGALGIGVARGLRAFWPKNPAPADHTDEEERLMTALDNEPVRLAVHVRPLEGA